MYCRNCGKKLDTDAEFCNECLAKFDDFSDDGEEISENKSEVEQTITDSTYSYSSHATYQPEKRTPSQKEGSIMAGFGPALTGTILSVVGFIFVLIAFVMGTMVAASEIVPGDAISYYETLYPDTVFLAKEMIQPLKSAGWFFWISGIAMTIISLILGIKSIKLFVNARREGLRKKPIPALAIGIETVIMAGIAIFYALLALIVLSVI